MHQIHPNARTNPAVRAEIAHPAKPSGVLARRFSGEQRDHPQVAQARTFGLPRPLGPAP
jgi:hypothetical protein